MPSLTLLDGYLASCLPKFEAHPKIATFLANFVTVVQEYMAVTFQLVCLSRLETTADMKSLLVLFLTLVVFTGPYLNAWLLFTDYIFFKDWSSEKDGISTEYTIIENIFVGLAIIGFHVLGSFTAAKIVGDWHVKSTPTITWNTTATTMQKDNVFEVHFLEEMFAVTSLLIGCVYLLWLRKIRRAKPAKKHEDGITKIEITFYLQLTLLVAAVSQAFPDAYLSPHVGFYKVFMGRISHSVLMSRLGGGAVGLLLSSIWILMRANYRHAIADVLDEEHEHAPKYTTVPRNIVTEKLNPGSLRNMPSIRLSMHGGSYF